MRRRSSESAQSVRFANPIEANLRLDENPSPLTEDEIRALLPHFMGLNNSGKVRLQTELSLIQVAAIEQFDASSTKLGNRMLGLTWAIGILALFQLIASLWAIIKH